jgi:hypothetical protein
MARINWLTRRTLAGVVIGGMARRAPSPPDACPRDGRDRAGPARRHRKAFVHDHDRYVAQDLRHKARVSHDAAEGLHPPASRRDHELVPCLDGPSAFGIDQLRGPIVDDPEQGGLGAQPWSGLVLRQPDRWGITRDPQCLDDDLQRVGGAHFGGFVGGARVNRAPVNSAASTEARSAGSRTVVSASSRRGSRSMRYRGPRSSTTTMTWRPRSAGMV